MLHHRESDTAAQAASGGTNVPELSMGVIVGYSQDGRTIVSAGANEWVMVWDATTPAHRLLDVVHFTTHIYSCSISPDGRHVALGTESPAVNVLDLEHLHGRPRVIMASGQAPR